MRIDRGSNSGRRPARLPAVATLLLLAAALAIQACTTASPTSPAPRPDPVAPTTTGEPRLEYTDWMYLGRRGQVITTDHFRIYTTMDRIDLLDDLPVFYEGCLDAYMTALTPLPRPGKMMESYIFRNSREWKHKTREVLPNQADAFMNLGRGGFTTQGTSVLYNIGSYDTFAIAAHEGWHQYTQSTFRHPLPIWLEEGIATYMEGVSRPNSSGEMVLRPWRNEERRRALDRALQSHRLIPLRELLNSTPQSFLNSGKDRLLVYYAQVWALTRFLAEGEDGRYRPALEELLTDAAEGRIVSRMSKSREVRLDRRRGVIDQTRRGPAILLEYFNSDFETISDELDRYIRAVAARTETIPST